MIQGALSGVRVIDLSRVLGGPLCTQHLGDHGADVIKLEPPTGDETRFWGPFGPDGSAYYGGINRNKRHAALDLSSSDGRDVLLNLLSDADVLVHNFKPGTMERWGIGFDDMLSVRFPRLIYCHITGFGEDGPLGGLPGYDAIVQAMTGCASVNGQRDGEPTRVGMSIVDIGAAYNAIIAICMALYERERSGRGQKIDIALYDCALAYLHPHAVSFMLSGVEPRPAGNQHPSIAPYEQFETATGAMFLGVGNDQQFLSLCRLLERPDLCADPRYATNALRLANRPALHEALQASLQDLDASALSRTLMKNSIPAGPVRTVGEALAEPHTTHREMIVAGEDYKGLGIPIKFSRTRGSIRRIPTDLGADSREVCKLAGYSDDAIEDLISRGVVFDSPSKDEET